MDYSMLIQNRKSVRAFSSKKVPAQATEGILSYYKDSAGRLVPGIRTELLCLGKEAQKDLEGACGYNDYLIGAPQYLILLSEQAPAAGINAGYIMEDLVLKLTDDGFGTCWITFTDSDKVKKAAGITSELDVAAIVAFGYGERTVKRLRLNIFSMSNVDVKAKRHYFDPKRNVTDMVFMDEWGRTEGAEEYIGFYDDMLWEALYAASLSPSYLNRQPYGFVIKDSKVTLVERPDDYTPRIDADLGLGIVLLHFTSVITRWHSTLSWTLGGESDVVLPEGYRAVGVCGL